MAKTVDKSPSLLGLSAVGHGEGTTKGAKGTRIITSLCLLCFLWFLPALRDKQKIQPGKACLPHCCAMPRRCAVICHSCRMSPPRGTTRKQGQSTRRRRALH